MSRGPPPSRRGVLGSFAVAVAGLAGGTGNGAGWTASAGDATEASSAREAAAQTVTQWPLAGYGPANTKHTGHDATASPPTDPGIGWNLVRERAFGSPAIRDGRVFVHTVEGDAATLYALDPADGSVQWQYDLGFDLGENAGPAVDGERVVVGGSTVRALDPATGDLLWAADAVDYCLSTPTISDGTVYAVCQADDIAETHLFAFDAVTGELLWETEEAGERYYPPVAVGDSVYLDGVAFARADGSKRWERSLPGHPVTYPVVANGTLFLTVDLRNDDRANGRVYALAGADGTTEWTAELTGGVSSMPAYADGTVYVGDRDDGLYAFDTADGTRRWKQTVDAEVPAPPLVAGGALLVVSGSRLTIHDPATGAERAALDLPGYVSGWLAAAGDRLFVGASAGAGSADAPTLEGFYAIEPGGTTLPDPSVSVNTDPVRVDQPVDLAATLETQPDRPVAYEWEVFDLQSDATEEPVATFTGQSGTFTPEATHRYQALLRVTIDGDVTDYASAVLAARRPTATPSPSPAATLSPTRTPTVSPTRRATPMRALTDTPTRTPAAGGGMNPLLLGGTGLLGAGGLAYGAYRYLGGNEEGDADEPGDGPSPAAGVGAAHSADGEDAGFGTAPNAGTSSDPRIQSDPARAPDPAPTPDVSAGSTAESASRSAPEPPAEPSFDAVDLGAERARLSGLVVNEAIVDGEQAVVWTLGEYDGTITVETTTAFAEAADTWTRIAGHENVVPVLGWGTAPIPWLATADTGTLLPDCDLDRGTTLSVLADASSGIYNGHRYGVAHGSLSPAALRVTDEADNSARRCMVDQWRLPAVIRSRLDLDPQVEAYRAPELADGAVPDDRSDNYALAAIAYEQLTGYGPFTQPTLRDPDGPATVANLKPVGAFDGTLSGPVSETVERALATDPERVETALYLRDAFREVGGDG